MGRKRKCDSSSNEEIMTKIRRLEKILKQKRRLRLPSTSSSSSGENERANHNTRQNEDDLFDTEGDTNKDDHNTDAAAVVSPQPATTAPPECSPSSGAGTGVPPPPPPYAPSPSAPVLTAADQAGTQDPELDEAILTMLGDAPTVEMEMGPPVHKDIALRLKNIVLKGLSDELRKKLISECSIPSNMENLVPPVLNPEIKAALPDNLIKKDYSLLNRQKQLSAVLSALCKSLDILISTKEQKVIKPISDTCRLLSDMFYHETRIRRLFIINAINVQMKNVIVDTVADKYLFGENIADKLKAAQTIKRSGDMLKPVQKTFNKNNFISGGPFKNLNQKGPYRKPAVRAETGRFRVQNRTASTPAAPASSNHRGPPPPPPPARARQTYRRR